MVTAKYHFFPDCIGSAFNAKGIMQCPNCRKIEKGNWLYANGSRPSQDVNMDEWAHDEDLYDVNYSEMVCDIVNLTPELFIFSGVLAFSLLYWQYAFFLALIPVFEFSPLSFPDA
jgi:hypothetical protein